MSTATEAPTKGAADAPASKTNQVFKNCWSCRMLSGGGLILSGVYVYSIARRVMRQGGPTAMGTVAQITFAACLTAWGVVIVTDPVGRELKRT